jgi:diguanylate cyclase (GGDEF)-like protein
MLPGYRIIDLIHEGSQTLVYRAQCLNDCQSRIFKLPKSEEPTIDELDRLRHQFVIAKNLNLEGIVRPYSLEKYDKSLILVMEDFGGISLQKYVDIHGVIEHDRENSHKVLLLRDFLRISIQISTTIEQIIQKNVIHQNIDSHNILINSYTKEVKLTDFSHGLVLSQEEQQLNPYRSQSSLDYVFSEQIDSIDREIDYRSDYYALGVTFYQLLTGNIFSETDRAIEQPIPPQHLNSNIPDAVSQIILKLLAKDKDVAEGYQTIFGLRSDLERCLQQWKETGTTEPISADRNNSAPCFAVPEQFYLNEGREKDISLEETSDAIDLDSNNSQNQLDFKKLARCYLLDGETSRHTNTVTILKALQSLGVHLPFTPSKVQILSALLQTKLALHEKSIESLVELPQLTDINKIAVAKILAIKSFSTPRETSELTSLLTFQSVIRSLKYGNDALSSYGYVGYGAILCGVLEEFAAGYEFGKLAVDLVEKFKAKELKARILSVFYNSIAHWYEHIKTGLQPLEDAYLSGVGKKREFAGYAAYLHCDRSYWAGVELNELASKMATYQKAIADLESETILRSHQLYRQVISNFMGTSTTSDRLIGEIYNEEALLPIFQQENRTSELFDLYWHKLILCYCFGNYDGALENAEIARQYLDREIGTLSLAIFHFYDSLARLSVYSNASESEKSDLLRQVKANQQKMKLWAKNAPMNYLHKFYLVEAETDRVLDRVFEAGEHYDRAIELARKNEYVNEEALSQELAAKFYLQNDRERIASVYLKDAYDNYSRWGASAKVRDLSERYPHLLFLVLRSKLQQPCTKDNFISWQTLNSSITSTDIQLVLSLITSLDTLVRATGADKGYLILHSLQKFNTDKEIISQSDRSMVLTSITDLTDVEIPVKTLERVKQTLKPIIVDRASQLSQYIDDVYISKHQPQSLLCFPLSNRNRLLGILYLENTQTSGVFSNQDLPLINFCGMQISLSLENQILHQYVEQAEARETEKSTRLEKSLEELQEAQTQLIEAQVQLQHDAFHDPLTGLPNRVWLMKMLDHAIKLGQRHPNYLYAVLFLDLDRFKIVNDSLGHLVGDELLKSVAKKLQGCIRVSDTVARFGGDEFAILLEEMEDPQEATIVAQRIQDRLSEPFQLKDYEVCTGTSIGIAISTMNYQQADELLRDADTAMYQAKSEGKGRYTIFDRGMQTRALTTLQLESDLRKAIEKQEFCLYYQPIVSLETDRITAFEALIRWYHPQQGWIAPDEFIPVAEETGLIHQIGKWILQSACEQLEVWRKQFPQLTSLVVNVNFSAMQLKQVDILEQLQTILPQAKLPGFGLKLEITESCILEAVNWEAERLKQLKELGIGLCIDDFGTGYSSLSRLHEFPIDTLKIDRSFVNRLHLNSSHHDTVNMIVNLAHSLGMDVVAEGVENDIQLEKLKQLNCEFAQGYLFSKPVDSEMATKLLEVGSRELTAK